MPPRRWDAYDTLKATGGGDITSRGSTYMTCVGENWEGRRCGWVHKTGEIDRIHSILLEMETRPLSEANRFLRSLAGHALCDNPRKSHRDQAHVVIEDWQNSLQYVEENVSEIGWEEGKEQAKIVPAAFSFGNQQFQTQLEVERNRTRSNLATTAPTTFFFGNQQQKQFDQERTISRVGNEALTIPSVFSFGNQQLQSQLDAVTAERDELSTQILKLKERLSEEVNLGQSLFATNSETMQAQHFNFNLTKTKLTEDLKRSQTGEESTRKEAESLRAKLEDVIGEAEYLKVDLAQSNTEYSRNIEKLQSQLESEQSTLSQERDKLEYLRGALADAKANFTSQLNSQQSTLLDEREELEYLRVAIADVQGDLSSKQSTLSNERKKVEQVTRLLAETQESFTSQQTMLSKEIELLTGQLAETHESLTSEQNIVLKLREELNSKKAELAETHESLTSEKNIISRQRQELNSKRAELAETQESLVSKQNTISDQQRDIDSIADELVLAQSKLKLEQETISHYRELISLREESAMSHVLKSVQLELANNHRIIEQIQSSKQMEFSPRVLKTDIAEPRVTDSHNFWKVLVGKIRRFPKSSKVSKPIQGRG
jgi:DNA repair exonuclease SbcCD ATPase subunit